MKSALTQKILLAVVPWLVTSLQRLVYGSMKKTVLGEENIDRLREQHKQWILSIWHTNVLYSPMIHEGQTYGVMVSKSFDGELIARTTERLGHIAIRGSSSRDGKKALKTLIQTVRKGHCVAITPDGPTGPFEKVKPGVVIAAQLTGLPVIPFYYDATRKWIATKAWDQHIIPKPFAHLVLCYGPPIYVPGEMTDTEFEEMSQEIEEAMAEVKARCQVATRKLAEGADRASP